MSHVTPYEIAVVRVFVHDWEPAIDSYTHPLGMTHPAWQRPADTRLTRSCGWTPGRSGSDRGRRRSREAQRSSAKTGRAPLRPLSSCSPRDSKDKSDPSSRSRVVPETSTSPGPPREATRAAA
jgi:hypothetical protein